MEERRVRGREFAGNWNDKGSDCYFISSTFLISNRGLILSMFNSDTLILDQLLNKEMKYNVMTLEGMPKCFAVQFLHKRTELLRITIKFSNRSYFNLLLQVMIIDYKLTYPSGTATALLINSFHTSTGAELAG